MVRIRPIAAGLMLFTAAALAYGLTATPAGPRTLGRFDPDRMADVELRMWQAYYAKERVRLFALLVTMLHEQNHYPWVTAMREGFYLARAAATFGDARSNYDRVLPDGLIGTRSAGCFASRTAIYGSRLLAATLTEPTRKHTQKRQIGEADEIHPDVLLGTGCAEAR
jgi:hypothetical protein